MFAVMLPLSQKGKKAKMADLLSLYQFAESEDITVDCFELNNREALSFLSSDGKCYIAIDPFKLQSESDELLKLAHEMGHCVTGSFYNHWSTLDIRQKHERRADVWAIKKLLPLDELYRLYRNGITQPWELAEELQLSENFILKAIEYYHEHDTT